MQKTYKEQKTMKYMAKIKLDIDFDNKEWKPIQITTETSDKNAYRIYRLVIPKKSDFDEFTKKEDEKSKQPEFSESGAVAS